VTILVFGQTGQVAREILRRAEVMALGRDEAELSDPDACAEAIDRLAPDAVINAAAYTAVDRAESDEAAAHVVNAQAPGAIARAAAKAGIPFVHISSDYVFDGSGTRPWKPGDPTGPLGAYGRTKLAGEEAIRAAGGPHAILRTSWVFSAHGNNFVKTMLRLGAERPRLTIVADQVGGPTWAGDIADACLTMAEALIDGRGVPGTYHFAGAPDVSWADFARQIFRLARLSPEVVDIPSSDYPTPAKRPLNSRLDCSDLESEFGIVRPDWSKALSAVIAELRSGTP
jgi:dTDP-4-dehydrorhamnose reductase